MKILKAFKWAAVVAALVIAAGVIAPYVAAQSYPMYTGDDYGMVVDIQRRCVIGWATAALDSSVVCQEGALLWRIDENKLYTMTSGSWTLTTLTGQTIASPSISDPTITGAITRTGQPFMMKAGSKVGGTAGWVVAAADNVHLLTVPASQTGSKLIIPVAGLKIGDIITSFNLVGQIESAGNTVTVDVDLRKQTAAAADVTDASIGTITQLSVTADTIMSSTNTAKTLATPDTIAADETFYLIVTATTGASTDIALQGAVVTVTEK